MIGQLLMSLVTDLLFGWVSSSGRSFQTEITEYMARRGLVASEEGKKVPTR